MALRSEKTIAGLIVLTGLALRGAPLEFRVEHDHWRKSRPGVLAVDASGVRYTEEAKPKEKKPHRYEWSYQDIQQLTVAGKRLTVLSYEDVRWKLGADRRQEFLLEEGTFAAVYQMLKDKLDQRFVAALPDADAAPLWELPVKHLRPIRGQEGTLAVGRGSIVFRTAKDGESRTWRFEDIDNISSSGPFELTITTFERSRAHYGSRKAYNFQLKQRLSEERYQDLWRMLHPVKDWVGTLAVVPGGR